MSPTVAKVKKAVAPRKKKLSLEFAEPSKNYDSVALGVINEDKAYEYAVNSPLFITGYHVNHMDYVRRLVIAHYSSFEDTQIYCADFNNEMKDIGDARHDIFTSISNDVDHVHSMFKTLLADTSSARIVLYVNDCFKYADDKELVALLLKLINKAHDETNFTIFLQSHASRLGKDNVEAQKDVLDYFKSKLLIGNLLYTNLRFLFGEDRATKVPTYDKNQNTLYHPVGKPIKFEIYKILPTWFKQIKTLSTAKA